MKSRKLLMIPGPIEFEPEVLSALGQPTTSHVAPNFIQSFGNAMRMMRKVWLAPTGQPFIMAGTGTLAMDMAAVNLIEKGDKVLVISTGYFGLRYAELLLRYGAEVTFLQSEVGDVVPLEMIEDELKKGDYKLLTFTHVDTSTAVMVDPKPIGKLALKYNVLSILDGVCSVAGEEIRQEEWGIDVVLTASQKAIGVPPGLALLVASKKAMNVWKNRKTPVANYYSDWSNWLPIMQAYESGNPSYFGTPAVNLVMALEKSLEIILDEGMDVRFARHQLMAKAFREAMKAMGLKNIPINDEVSAATLSAPYYPDGITGGQMLAQVNIEGVILAGGLLPEIKGDYFRIGHMGSINRADTLATISAIEVSLKKGGHIFEEGVGVKAAQRVLS
ncbi:MAG: alanine--glyoxylate aminotransferase family protein [Salinivirgaceae bacterium]|jgi:alanine-glyoxylate transaminase/serine-glyoxylate transaminase/serine-pyruvate transaminase|nr:alanine--glyoxylate aminotransferase family protein [Salinivirgaceae bacterium]